MYFNSFGSGAASKSNFVFFLFPANSSRSNQLSFLRSHPEIFIPDLVVLLKVLGGLSPFCKGALHLFIRLVFMLNVTLCPRSIDGFFLHQESKETLWLVRERKVPFCCSKKEHSGIKSP